ncbi:hypothetical protein V5F32_00990 [Xanthobacter oligotrophicus]|uniref:Uncharacterized protein n=1 Tax=Xanthobacter oligotrophicus TaxID=2607286 RepID=A0ABW6ZQ56_9HYPH
MAPRIIRSFFQAVGLMSRGKVEEKLNTKLAEALEALEQHPEEKATAEVGVVVVVTKLGDRYDLKPKLMSKLPKEKELSSTTFWPLEGGLSVEHPSQSDMFAPRDAASRRSEPA